MTVPDIPPGFDFTDPEIYATRVPAEELAELRRTAPVWWVTQRRGSAGLRRRGVLGGHPARRRHGGVQDAATSTRREENTALIRFKEGMPRESIEMQRIILLNMDPPAAHQAARHRLPRLHPAGHRQPAPGPDRTRPAHRGHRAGVRHRRLRHRRGLRAAAAGHQRAARRPAGGPGQDLRLVQPDDRLRRRVPGEENDGEMAAAEILGYSMAMAEERRDCPAGRHHHQADQRRDRRARRCPTTSSGSSC